MLKGLLASHKRSCCNSNRCSCGVWAETCLIVLSVENGWLKNDQPFVGQLLPQTLRHTQIYLGRTRSCSGFAQSGHGFNRPEGRTNGFSAKKKHISSPWLKTCWWFITLQLLWHYLQPLVFLPLGLSPLPLAPGDFSPWEWRRMSVQAPGQAAGRFKFRVKWWEQCPKPSLVDSYIYGLFMGFYGLWVIFSISLGELVSPVGIQSTVLGPTFHGRLELEESLWTATQMIRGGLKDGLPTETSLPDFPMKSWEFLDKSCSITMKP